MKTRKTKSTQGDTDEAREKELLELRRLKLYRMQNEKYRFYEPSGVIETFINAFKADVCFILFLSAGNGIGKSSAAVNIVANLMYGGENPWFQGGLFDNWPYLKRARFVTESALVEPNMIRELKFWFPRNKYTTSKGGKHYESVWQTNTGWDFDIMTYDQDPMQFEGSTLGLAWFDEPPPDAILKATIARMRRGGIIIITATPISGSAHLYDLFATGNIETEVVLREGEDPVKVQRKIFHLTADVESVCFTGGMEVLTRSGWCPFNSVGANDEVASVSMPDRTFEYLLPSRLVHKTTKHLVDVKGLVCTPDHEFPAIRDDGLIHLVQAKDLYRGNRLFYNARQTKWSSDISPIQSIEPLAWARFLGWYVSEGSFAGSKTGIQAGKYQVYVSQKTKRDELREDLARTGMEWKERKNGDFWLSSKELHSVVSELGHAKQKHLPRYVFDASDLYRREVLEGLVLGDGDKKNGNRFRYRTTSRQLANDVQQLGISLGMASRISEQYVPERNMQGRTLLGTIVYWVYLRDDPKNMYVEHKPKIRDVAETDVFCVTVPNGYIVVRNPIDRVPIIAGNCKTHGIRGHLEHEHIVQMVAEYPEEERQARVYGKFQHLTGLIYKRWSRDIHVIEPFNVNPRDFCVFHALDPHPRNPDAAIWIAVDKYGTKYIVDELYIKPEDVEMLAYNIKKKNEQYRMVEPFVADPSAFIVDQHTGRSLASQLLKYGVTYIEASKARTAADKRIETAIQYQQTNGSMVRHPELYVFSNCKRFIYEMEHYRWQEWKGKAIDQHDKKEKPVDKDDHTIECVGRILIQEPVFIPYNNAPVRTGDAASNLVLDPYA